MVGDGTNKGRIVGLEAAGVGAHVGSGVLVVVVAEMAVQLASRSS